MSDTPLTRVTFRDGALTYGVPGAPWPFSLALGSSLHRNCLWFWLSLLIPFDRKEDMAPKLRVDIHDWCVENQITYELTVDRPGSPNSEQGTIWFRAEDDALLFKLRWLG